jgi:hypothetical protein
VSHGIELGRELGESNTPIRLRRSGLIAITVAAVLVALALLIVPGITTLQPGYHERFPGSRESIQHWRESSHARMTCGECHLEPGSKGVVEYGLKAIPVFYSQLLSGKRSTDLLGPPSSQACMKCHSTTRQVSADGDLLIPHRTHIDKLGIECAECHGNLVHTKNPRGLNRPRMTGCVESCHDGKRATDKCEKCHTGKQVPDSHRQKNWLQIHQTESKKVECRSCHEWSPDFCADCHSRRPASHQGNWRKLHADKAKTRGESVCRFCHEAKFCTKCH